MLAYLSALAGSIDAVDLNPAHIALNRLKLAAFRPPALSCRPVPLLRRGRQPPQQRGLRQFIAPNLDEATRRYWERRGWRGKRRIAVFERNFYRTGMLGLFIGIGHLARPAARRRSGRHDESGRMREQRRFFEEQLAPLFDRRLIRWITSLKSSLFALGIPPAQYDALVSAGDGEMARVLSMRLEKLACHFPAEGQLFRLAGLRPPLSAAGRGCAARLPRRGELPRRSAPMSIASTSTIATSSNCCKAEARRQRRPLRPARRAGLDERPPAERAVDRDHPHRRAGRAGDLPHRCGADIAAGPRRRRPARTSGAIAKTNRIDFTRRDRSAIYGGFHLYVKKA